MRSKALFCALFCVLSWRAIFGVTSGVENFESLKVLETVLPRYPQKMAFLGIYEGSARVLVSVDHTGKLIEVFQESYSHPEFGRLADEYVRKWVFQPSKLNGEPINSIKPIDFNFDDKRGVFSVGLQEAAASLSDYARFANSKRVYNFEELDKGLEPIEMQQPFYPREFKDSGMRGSATVMFYVDETGSTRMSHVTDYSHERFGEAALSAVENWKFKSPTVRDKPVSVLVSQRFDFTEQEK